MTYEQFGQRVARLARALMDRGIVQRKVAAMVAPNVHEFLEAYYACAVLGAVLNPVNFRLASGEMSFILQDSGAELILAHTDFAEKVQKAIKGLPQGQGGYLAGRRRKARNWCERG